MVDSIDISSIADRYKGDAGTWFSDDCLFRSRYVEDIKEIFVEIVRLCAKLGMVDLEHIIFDGTKLKAIASVR